MIRLRPAGQRGYFDHGWLDTHHSFSFASYFDPEHMGFRALRVINEDRIAAGRGFGTHGHQDMEILTYVLSGTLTHRDSMGHEQSMGPNELQRMSAGTGVMHSEFNGSSSEELHLLQIWLLPDRSSHSPGYEQFAFDPAEKRNRWRLLAAPWETPQSEQQIARIHQDARLSVVELEPGHELVTTLDPARHAWLQVARGAIALNGLELEAGDGAALSDESSFTLRNAGREAAELLFFDLA